MLDNLDPIALIQNQKSLQRRDFEFIKDGKINLFVNELRTGFKKMPWLDLDKVEINNQFLICNNHQLKLIGVTAKKYKQTNIVGRVRTKTVKKGSKLIIEKHYPMLGLDFHHNKKVVSEAATIQSKRLRNQVAGYVTHLMKRIQNGPVKGISIKLQEEERERKDNYVPEVSALAQKEVEIDRVTESLIKKLRLKIPGLKLVQDSPQPEKKSYKPKRK